MRVEEVEAELEKLRRGGEELRRRVDEARTNLTSPVNVDNADRLDLERLDSSPTATAGCEDGP